MACIHSVRKAWVGAAKYSGYGEEEELLEEAVGLVPEAAGVIAEGGFRR